jgi:TM2 domain-containing membrane protein YozV
MNCANHPETPATAFCRQCGKPMCADCQRPALGSIFCAEHVPVAAAAPFAPPPPPPFAPEPPPINASRATPPPPPPPYTPPADAYAASSSPYAAANPYTAPPEAPEGTGHPALALLLGFIPGVGAIYNGQYAKGLIHVVVFGLLISLTSSSHGSLQPLFGVLIGAWVFYMAFEAYHTARKRRYGIAVEEFSSLFDVRPVQGRFPAGALLLIGLGFILLLNTTDIISMDQLERYWPVGLIVFGLYLLYARLSPAAPAPTTHPDQNAEAPK